MPTIPPELRADQFEEMVDALPVIAWRANAKTFHFTFVSKAVESILGFPAQQWIDDTQLWSRQIHPEDRHVIDICHSETKAGRDHEFTYRMYAADGRVVWIRDRVSVRSEHGVPTEIFGVMLDVTAAMQTELALQRSEANHRRMLETLPDGFAVHVEGRLVYVNQELLRILGATDPSQVLGRQAISFVIPDDVEAVKARQEELRQGRAVPLSHKRLLSLTGQVVDVEVSGTPTTYNGSEAMQLVVRDLRERLEAEKELQGLDERLRVLAAGTSEAMWEWNLETGDLWTNNSHYELFRPTGEQARFEDWIERVHPDDRERVRKRSLHVVDTVARRWSDEYRFRFPDGTYGWILDRGSVIPGPDGKAHRMIGEMLDVTPHRAAREALEHSEQRYRDLVEDVRDVIYSTDIEGRFTSMNAAFEKLTGFPAADWIGRSTTDLMVSRFVHPAIAHFERALAGTDIVGQYQIRSQSGAFLDVEVSAHARIIGGKPVGIIGIIRDVTARNALEAKVEESKRLSSLGHLAASMAHEFNNVLMSIQPFAEFIARDAAALPRSADACRHILQAVARGKKVSQEILRFANPKQAQLDPLLLSSWLEDALAQAGAGIPHNIMISTSLHPLCDRLQADRSQLDQVFINLLFNARDAMPDGGSIVIEIAPAEHRWRQQLSLDPSADFIRLSVIDSGAGIDADVLPRIFEPLFTTKRNGTGLGLSIARKLIEVQGGVISVESAPGRGTSFHLFLRSATAPSSLEKVPETADHTIRQVVLVEDERSVAEGMSQLLDCVGIETTHVDLGGAAHAAIRESAPDAVIVDLNLPDMNGLDLCRSIRSEWPSLPIVIATGHVELAVTQDQAHTVSLMKPYSLDDLLAAIQVARG